MNLCFVIGKVLKDVEFKFLYKDKRISIAYTDLELKNNSKITIKSYGKNADLLYRKIKINDIIFVNGKIINTDVLEIEALEIRKL